MTSHPWKYISTAYSGNTAIRVITIIANGCGISIWATSHAHIGIITEEKIANALLHNTIKGCSSGFKYFITMLGTVNIMTVRNNLYFWIKVL